MLSQTRLALAAFAVMLTACHEGNNLANDFGVVEVDLAEPADMNVGPSCGDILGCTVKCGLSDIACSAMCFQGAQKDALSQAGQLLFCAGVNCIASELQSSPDGGGADGGSGLGSINPLQLIFCISDKCNTQLGMCQGFSLGSGLPQ